MNSAEIPENVGIIAGNGIYPETFIHAARKAGVSKLIVSAFTDETEPGVADLVDEIAWLRVGQLGKMIKHFKAHEVKHAVMVGQIAPKNLFDLRPDLRLLKMLSKVKERNAETLFGAIADELEKDGIRLLPATTFLDDLLPDAGPVCGPALSDRQEEDAAYGFRIAKEVSRLDIGQTVVVKKGTVLAVEAFEGTNEALKRGGALGKGEAMMVKVSKPKQDFRFDVPVVGPSTIETAAEAGVNVIVVEAKSTLLLGKDEIVSLCDEKSVSIVAREE
ncbi:UDP-2,3-diacylglucosamine diphosphatase LpxI [Verrucomicrobiales bacterium]|jgi:UDP-2,3-diacylglucosamine hydrolase|nr:UDP-2,3-diacylglucosamine diphosphatase LpxI [Verrucomicrobiales bacterium]|tara:strand:- start:93 stop:917 length:825 start_codon:yes stop_codon:yes gene_type:complete